MQVIVCMMEQIKDDKKWTPLSLSCSKNHYFLNFHQNGKHMI
jgi:hypothetical protein